MERWTKFFLVPLLVAALVFSSAGFSAFAEASRLSGTEGEPTGEQMVADLFFVRPVGIVATAFGSLCFLVSLPCTGPTKKAKVSWDKLVAEPAEFTFARPMGEMEY